MDFKKEAVTDSEVLDLGCGGHCLPGAVGLDLKKLPGVQVVHDLNFAPWPFPDSRFGKVHCQHVIEHIQRLDVLAREIYRVSQHQALLRFITPHYSCYKSWINPHHLHHFALGSIPQLFKMELGDDKFCVVGNEIKFSGAVIEFFGWLIYRMSPKQYEKHFSWIFPATEIHTVIQIIKE